jgi:hypothetical protein
MSGSRTGGDALARSVGLPLIVEQDLESAVDDLPAVLDLVTDVGR